ncbi:MAG TPA: DUF1203 domain-containing protein [Hyphomonadaceae bacterium]|nr:DUF1203 domain-containing protein [Hyphomonadaceae bacterium]
MFQVSALPAARFSHLYGLSDDALNDIGVVVMTADSKPGFPCRVSLRDAEPGSRMLLLNYEHQDAATPYRSRHAIFVTDGAVDAAPAPGEVPEQIRVRLLSVRAFTPEGMIVDADVVDGARAGEAFERMLADDRVGYLHAHFAKFGCYAARIDRAS